MKNNFAFISQSVASSVAALVNEYAAASDERKRELIRHFRNEAKESEFVTGLDKKLLDDPRLLAAKDNYSSEGKALGTIAGAIIGGSLGGAAGAGVGAAIGGAVGSVIGENIPKNAND
jgi:hypothetical protein